MDDSPLFPFSFSVSGFETRDGVGTDRALVRVRYNDLFFLFL